MLKIFYQRLNQQNLEFVELDIKTCGSITKIGFLGEPVVNYSRGFMGHYKNVYMLASYSQLRIGLLLLTENLHFSYNFCLNRE